MSASSGTRRLACGGHRSAASLSNRKEFYVDPCLEPQACRCGHTCGRSRGAFCADQYAGRDLGQINGALCELASSSAGSSAVFDVTDGNNVQAGTGIAGYSAGAGWDAVTGLGTPNGANFVPAPVAAANS